MASPHPLGSTTTRLNWFIKRENNVLAIAAKRSNMICPSNHNNKEKRSKQMNNFSTFQYTRNMPLFESREKVPDREPSVVTTYRQTLSTQLLLCGECALCFLWEGPVYADGSSNRRPQAPIAVSCSARSNGERNGEQQDSKVIELLDRFFNSLKTWKFLHYWVTQFELLCWTPQIVAGAEKLHFFI